MRSRSICESEEEPHQSPRLSYRLDGSELFVMYQLASGAWTVGARDAQSGRISWQQSLPQAERGTNVEALFPAGDRVYVARDWRLDVLDAGDGRYLGRI